MKDLKGKWVVALSNGDRIVQGEGSWTETEGDLSSWQRLLKYIKENKLHITFLGAILGNKTYHLPSVNPKFRGAPPGGFTYRRRVIGNVEGQEIRPVEKYIVLKAHYQNFDVVLYVDEYRQGDCWVSIEPTGEDSR